MSPEQLLEELRDQIRGMWRYRWYLIGVAWLIALPGWAYVYGMPDVYQATAKVSVDTNSLLPSLTRGLTASEDLGDEVGLVSKALLSRPNLEEVARQTIAPRLPIAVALSLLTVGVLGYAQRLPGLRAQS